MDNFVQLRRDRSYCSRNQSFMERGNGRQTDRLMLVRTCVQHVDKERAKYSPFDKMILDLSTTSWFVMNPCHSVVKRTNLDFRLLMLLFLTSYF